MDQLQIFDYLDTVRTTEHIFATTLPKSYMIMGAMINLFTTATRHSGCVMITTMTRTAG